MFVSCHLIPSILPSTVCLAYVYPMISLSLLVLFCFIVTDVTVILLLYAMVWACSILLKIEVLFFFFSTEVES